MTIEGASWILHTLVFLLTNQFSELWYWANEQEMESSSSGIMRTAIVLDGLLTVFNSERD